MLLSIPGKVFSRILLDKMTIAVDAKPRDQQVRFRKNRSCIDQFCTQRIIVEQALECSLLSTLTLSTMRRLSTASAEIHCSRLRGITVFLISASHISCRVVHGDQLSETFEVTTGVRQGCLLTPFLFLLVIDWITITTTKGRKNGFQWSPWVQ